MTIKIEVKLVGVLHKLAEREDISLRINAPAVVKDAISELTNHFPSKFKQVLIDPELNDPRPNVLILINGREINVLKGLETRVKNGDKLLLIPVSHGG